MISEKRIKDLKQELLAHYSDNDQKYVEIEEIFNLAIKYIDMKQDINTIVQRFNSPNFIRMKDSYIDDDDGC